MVQQESPLPGRRLKVIKSIQSVLERYGIRKEQPAYRAGTGGGPLAALGQQSLPVNPAGGLGAP